jgi:hypothetical protein
MDLDFQPPASGNCLAPQRRAFPVQPDRFLNFFRKLLTSPPNQHLQKSTKTNSFDFFAINLRKNIEEGLVVNPIFPLDPRDAKTPD